MSSDVGVVVPAFRPDLDALLAYLEAVEDALSPAVLRVELDAPAAGVADAVRAAGVTVNVSARRRGKGAAVTHGFEALDTGVLAFADADGSTDAPSLAAVVEAVREGADVAVGSRRHPEADVRGHQSTLRRRFGDGFAAVARTALGVDVHDFQCGAKALSRAVWGDVRRHVFESGFAWDFEVLAVATALGYGVQEVPVRWEDHPDSTVPPFRTAASFLRALVTVRRRTRALAGGDTDGKRRDDRTPLAEEDAVGDE